MKRWGSCWIASAATLLLCMSPADAAPVTRAVYTFPQPDGTQVALHLYGDEFYIRAETPVGYTVVRDKSSGYICYAMLNDAGDALVSTGVPYLGEQFPPRVATSALLDPIRDRRHIALPHEALVAEVEKKFERLFPEAEGGPEIVLRNGVPFAAPPTTIMPALPEVDGTVRVLSIIADFSDAPATLSLEQYEASLNDPEWSNNRNKFSVKRYYLDVSGGRLTVEHTVFGVFRAPKTFAVYDEMEYGAAVQEVMLAALNQIEADGFDFSTLSTEMDWLDRSSIKAINIIYTGSPKTWS